MQFRQPDIVQGWFRCSRIRICNIVHLHNLKAKEKVWESESWGGGIEGKNGRKKESERIRERKREINIHIYYTESEREIDRWRE